MALSWLGAVALRRTRGLSRSLGVSAARYRSLVESSPDGMLIARRGVIEYANAAMARLAQVGDASQLVGRRVDSLLDGGSSRHPNDEFDGPPPGRAISVEYWLQPARGAPIEVETVIADGAPGDDASLQIVVRDISARKQAQRRLRDSEERYRLMVEGAPDCAFLLLDMDGVIEDVKPASGKVVLGRRQDLLGSPLGTLFTLEATARDEPTRLLRQARAAQAPQDREGWCRRTDGGRFWAHLVLSPLADQDEQPRGFHVLVRDIGARKRLQDELDANRQKLETLALASEAAREREKIRIARELHDELGQMLTVQQMDVEMLADELYAAPAGVRERIVAMRAHVDSALEMTRRIAGDLRPLVLDDLGLAAALQWLLAQARSRCRIEGHLELQGDAGAMRDELATALFRIAQESMTNVMRHAQASRVEIRLAIVCAPSIRSPRATWRCSSPSSTPSSLHDDGAGDRHQRPARQRRHRRGADLGRVRDRVRLVPHGAGGGGDAVRLFDHDHLVVLQAEVVDLPGRREPRDGPAVQGRVLRLRRARREHEPGAGDRLLRRDDLPDGDPQRHRPVPADAGGAARGRPLLGLDRERGQAQAATVGADVGGAGADQVRIERHVAEKRSVKMRYVYLGLLLGLAAVVFTFKFQNLESVTVNFMSASLTLPLSVLLLAVYVLGMLTGGVLLSLIRSWVHGATTKPLARP